MTTRALLRCGVLRGVIWGLALLVGATTACRPREPVPSPSPLVHSQPDGGPTASAQPPLFGDLTPGPHAVGFRQLMIHDAARAYSHPLAPSPQRPILLNLWYPAQPDAGQAMKVDDYLMVRGPLASADRRFADLLERHVREVFSEETLGREQRYFDSRRLARLPQILAQPVLARREAPAWSGVSPLVVAHPGLGGAFADNFVLYEYLASHGYVVITSAFQAAEGKQLNISWDPATSIADLDTIVRWAKESLRIHSIAVLGTSYGAQAALIYAMEGRPVDAVISLDSTLENGDPKQPWWKAQSVQSAWLDRAAQIRTPTLVVSTPEGLGSAFFDGLVACDRRSLKVPFLEHNDFESHGGVLQTRFAYDLRATDADSPSAAQVGASYRLVLRATLAFLDGVLRKDARALHRLDSELTGGIAGAKLTHLSHPSAVKPEELLRELSARGVEAAASYCAATAGCDEKEVFAEAGEQLIAAGDWESARKTLQWLTERHPEQFRAHSGLAEALVGLHKDKEALAAFQSALAVLQQEKDPSPYSRMLASRTQRRIQVVSELLAKGR